MSTAFNQTAQIAKEAEVRLDQQLKGAVTKISAQERDSVSKVDRTAPDAVKKALEQLPKRRFGEWERNMKRDTAYQAASDGFVVAMSGGDKATDANHIYTGQTTADLKNVCTRIAKYGGAVCPVAKGQFWMAKGGELTIQWMPVLTQ